MGFSSRAGDEKCSKKITSLSQIKKLACVAGALYKPFIAKFGLFGQLCNFLDKLK